ncbi:MAG: hypothetical protein EBY29_12880, partial [Planctomycetes bacterium]|nr:hypothetical protein [Planctomycetota bacterium]
SCRSWSRYRCCDIVGSNVGSDIAPCGSVLAGIDQWSRRIMKRTLSIGSSSDACSQSWIWANPSIPWSPSTSTRYSPDAYLIGSLFNRRCHSLRSH